MATSLFAPLLHKVEPCLSNSLFFIRALLFWPSLEFEVLPGKYYALTKLLSLYVSRLASPPSPFRTSLIAHPFSSPFTFCGKVTDTCSSFFDGDLLGTWEVQLISFQTPHLIPKNKKALIFLALGYLSSLSCSSVGLPRRQRDDLRPEAAAHDAGPRPDALLSRREPRPHQLRQGRLRPTRSLL